MTTVLDTAALLVTAAALSAAAVALVVTRRPGVALAVLLDLLTAAGLLRLAADPDWHRLASVAAVVALRQVNLIGLHRPGHRSTSRATTRR